MENTEEFKNISTIHLPDERSFNVYPFSLEALHAELSTIDLDNKIHESIRSHFNTGKNIFLYSWHHYPLKNAAEAHLITTLEMAFRYRITGEMWPAFDANIPGLSNLMKKAHSLNLFSIERLPKRAGCGLSHGQELELIKFVINTRNQYLHGSPMLIPRFYFMHLLASLINQIYENI